MTAIFQRVAAPALLAMGALVGSTVYAQAAPEQARKEGGGKTMAMDDWSKPNARQVASGPAGGGGRTDMAIKEQGMPKKPSK